MGFKMQHNNNPAARDQVTPDCANTSLKARAATA
jgi:hypothetical protein